jgi:acetolactate synthase-1/2/3 large subunit
MVKLYEALARAFVDEGTSTVFGLMGDANMHWMNALDKLGVRLVGVRHEGVGLAMADGFAQVSGSPGVCTTTSGPGVTQLATSLVVASRAGTPIVVFCGDSAVGDREAVQRFSHAAFAAAAESGHVCVESPASAFDAVAAAFYQARVQSRPVLLSVAIDTQQETHDDDDEEYVPSTAWVNRAPPYVRPDAVAQAADIVAASRRPVISVGRGARAANAGQAVLSLARRTGAVIATSLLVKNWLAEDEFHVGIAGLFSSRVAIELFSEADCVIAVGASLNHYTTEHGYLFPGARFVHIDRRQHAFMGDGRAADCYVQGDALVAVEALDEALARRSATQAGYRTPEVRTRLGQALADSKGYEIPEGTVDPRAACRQLDALLPADTGLVLGSGHQSHFATMLLTRPRALTFVNKYFGCIGQGLGTAVGAVMATGNRPAVLVEGDASFMMHLGDFDTAVRHRVPLLIVVFNDQNLGAEYHKSLTKGLNPGLAHFPAPDLGAVARALGGRGWRAHSEQDLRAAVGEFLAEPGPAVIDLHTAPDVLSIPYRRLWQGDLDA